jgi:adenylate cyclase
MLVEFPSVVDAVRCAAETQRAMIDRNTETPEDERITFRIGINLGDVIIDGDDIYGDGVNIAARLEALAEPGGICISRAVRNQIRDKLPYTFEDMGERSVKNIARPVRANAMSAAAVAGLPQVALPAQPTSPPRGMVARLFGLIGGRRSPAAVTSPSSASVTGTGKADKPAAAPLTVPRLSIVVLPFANLSNDPDEEYFADGITDDLTTDLSRISDSFVIARNTAFTYKNKPVDVRQVGRELGVRYVLESSLRRMGDQVQVNVQLVDADSGSHVWADRFDTDRRNLAEAQSETEITGRLARTLEFELVRQASHRIEQAEADNPDARDLVLRARALIHRPAAIAIREEARRLFERGLEIDPGSIDAKIGLATLLITTIKVGWSNSAQQDQARAEQLLVEVLERDAN